VTNADYVWEFDDGTANIFGVDTANVYHVFEDNDELDYNGGGGYRVKLYVKDQSANEGFMIIPVKVSVPPIFSESEVALPRGQTSICKGSNAPLEGVAYTVLWEDEPIYELVETSAVSFDDTDPYSDSLFFDEFPLTDTYASGAIDSVRVTLMHSNMGDVKISLVCDDSYITVLKDHDPTNTSALGEPVNGNLYSYSFSMIGADVMNNTIADTIAPGEFLSQETFDNFIGCRLNNKWELIVEDNQIPDSGFVESWEIFFEESVLPPIWTFRDTLVEFYNQNGEIYGTFWSSLQNVSATTVVSEADSIKGFATASPDRGYGSHAYKFNVVTNWGCPQDSFLTVRTEELSFSADKNNEPAKLFVTFTNETSWAVYRDWDFGNDSTAYYVERDSINAYTTYAEKGDYEVILIASDEYDCQESDTIIVSVLYEIATLENVPNAFSPNGDGDNDIWFFNDEDDLKGMKDFTLIIYNRWGEVVFKTDNTEDVINPNGWNGQIRNILGNNRGRPAKEGVYYYVIEAEGKSGQDIYKGRLTKKQEQSTDPVYHSEEAKGFIYLFR
jgi:gliding motility-associated-like protein